VDESHVEHAVGFIKHKGLHLIELYDSVVHQV